MAAAAVGDARHLAVAHEGHDLARIDIKPRSSLGNWVNHELLYSLQVDGDTCRHTGSNRCGWRIEAARAAHCGIGRSLRDPTSKVAIGLGSHSRRSRILLSRAACERCLQFPREEGPSSAWPAATSTLRLTIARYPHTGGMGIGRPTRPLNVTLEEREKLAMLARRPKTGHAMAMRARIVLGCDQGLSNGAVAKRLQITGATVCKWR